MEERKGSGNTGQDSPEKSKIPSSEKTEKQGTVKTELVKEDHKEKEEYIFQENPKTKIGTGIIIGFLIILVAGIVVSAVYFDLF